MIGVVASVHCYVCAGMLWSQPCVYLIKVSAFHVCGCWGLDSWVEVVVF